MVLGGGGCVDGGGVGVVCGDGDCVAGGHCIIA